MDKCLFCKKEYPKGVMEYESAKMCSDWCAEWALSGATYEQALNRSPKEPRTKSYRLDTENYFLVFGYYGNGYPYVKVYTKHMDPMGTEYKVKAKGDSDCRRAFAEYLATRKEFTKKVI